MSVPLRKRLHALTLLGCLVLGVAASCGKPLPPVAPAPTVHLDSTQQAESWQTVTQLLERRCLVCHGCYDAPCQLKLGSFAGIQRGASPALVYDSSRLTPAPPTRLGIDAHDVVGWREKKFHAVLPEGEQASVASSPLLRMLSLKREHPLPLGQDISTEFTLELNRKQSCPTAENFDEYAKEHPLWGMPYGLPGLNSDEERTVVSWVEAGAPHPALAARSPKDAEGIQRFESFFNEPTLKSRLMARYLYEHLFLASLHFGDEPDAAFYRLVRSRTAPGSAVEEIPTRRPFEDPKVERVYYRLVPREERPLEKTHMPYLLDERRLHFWRELFLDAKYEVSSLPSYEPELAANPFRAFQAIPASARYRFLLDEAEFSIMGFIKGPVCRGQVALDVIEDRFWIAFMSPDAPWERNQNAFLGQVKNDLDLPAEDGSKLLPTHWFGYAKEHAQYIQARKEFLSSASRQGERLTPEWIWNGNARNSNAALTVFRHFDSATVVKGFVGKRPKNAWILGYSQLERIHYLLVAGFDVFGNVTHQVMTRLYMDFLRMEGESGFLLFLPQSRRKALTEQWYVGVSGASKATVNDILYGPAVEPNIRYQTAEPEAELLNLIESRLAKVQSHEFELNAADTRDGTLRALEVPQRAASFMPETAFLAVTGPGERRRHFSLLRDSAHTNVAHLFNEEERRLPDADQITVVPGFLGAYPNALFEVKADDLAAFVTAVRELASAKDYKLLRSRFGVLRASERFWSHSDLLHTDRARASKRATALFDYNRLEGF